MASRGAMTKPWRCNDHSRTALSLSWRGEPRRTGKERKKFEPLNTPYCNDRVFGKLAVSIVHGNWSKEAKFWQAHQEL